MLQMPQTSDIQDIHQAKLLPNICFLYLCISLQKKRINASFIIFPINASIEWLFSDKMKADWRDICIVVSILCTSTIRVITQLSNYLNTSTNIRFLIHTIFSQVAIEVDKKNYINSAGKEWEWVRDHLNSVI